MCDAENLIMSVEKHQCLWDINHADYHNRDMKDLAWEQICKDLIQDWETCTDKVNKCKYFNISLLLNQFGLIILSLYWYDSSPSGETKYSAKLSRIVLPRFVDCRAERNGKSSK